MDKPEAADATVLPRVLVEFVSADPTGPLTLHQARNGVVGDALANLLTYANRVSETKREFYVNDGASALRVLARALWDLQKQNDSAPPSGLDGGAVQLPSALIAALEQNPQSAHFASVPFEEAAPFLQALVADFWQTEHEKTLSALGVRFDRFFKESELHAASSAGVAPIAALLTELQTARAASDEFGALWLRSSRLREGERDYVLRRADGSVTYLASDLAYHKNKFGRGFGYVVDVWNADHAAYVGRTRAGLTALGVAGDNLDVVLCGSVRLVRDGADVKDAGTPVLHELTHELGQAALRFALLNGSEAAPLLLDADRARLQTERNPFFVVQTAWQRLQTVSDADNAASKMGDSALAAQIAAFPQTVQDAADKLSPYLVARYVVELAHAWNTARSDNAQVKTVLRDALGILGVGTN